MQRLIPILCTLLLTLPVWAEHTVLLQGGNRLAKVNPAGEIVWEKKWGGIHDIHVLENGNIMVQQHNRRVVEIDVESGRTVWAYDCKKENGNGEGPVEVHAFQPLENGVVMIAESGPGRIIEVDREKKLLKEIKFTLDSPHPHRDTRLARKLDNGHYLVAHEGDGKVREYDDAGSVVWEYAIPLFGKEPAGGHGPEAFGNSVFSAVRLPNGNTLIGTGNGHSVLEVTPGKEIVWAIHQNDLPGITLAWVTTLEVLENGHYVIGNCHAGPGQPLLIEVAPKTKEVVWTFDHFDSFGNNVSNSLLVDQLGRSIR